jgi:hypothetical protein
MFSYEFLQGSPGTLSECSRKCHELLILWCLNENILNIDSHFEIIDHLVTLVKHEKSQLAQVQSAAFADQVSKASGGPSICI